MKKIKKTRNVKMNLTLRPDVYEQLKMNAQKDYVKVATWTKQLLMKSLHENNKAEVNCVTQND